MLHTVADDNDSSQFLLMYHRIRIFNMIAVQKFDSLKYLLLFETVWKYHCLSHMVLLLAHPVVSSGCIILTWSTAERSFSERRRDDVGLIHRVDHVDDDDTALRLTLEMVKAEFAAVEANTIVVDASKE